MSDYLEKISTIGLVPLVVLDTADDAVPLAKALVAGGIPIAEVTFRTAAAQQAIKNMAQQVPEILVGAGTVHTVEQAKIAVEAGSKFIVTPGLIPAVVEWCLESGVTIIPGVATPTEILQAMSYGLDTLKFFPAEIYGGISAIKALQGPFGDIKFMPTGGVNKDNYVEYLSLPNVAAVGGSFMLPNQLVASKDWAAITQLCRDTLQGSLGFQLLHVGINTEDEAEACAVSHQLADLFSLPVTEFPGAFFSGSMFEVIKGSFLGAQGHVAVVTNNMERAVAYFESRGIAFNLDTAARDDNGRLISYYFKEEIGGFAVHLRRPL